VIDDHIILLELLCGTSGEVSRGSVLASGYLVIGGNAANKLFINIRFTIHNVFPDNILSLVNKKTLGKK